MLNDKPKISLMSVNNVYSGKTLANAKTSLDSSNENNSGIIHDSDDFQIS